MIYVRNDNATWMRSTLIISVFVMKEKMQYLMQHTTIMIFADILNKHYFVTFMVIIVLLQE